MQFSFLGYSVKKIMELNLDVKDVTILRYFDDFRKSGKMNYEIIDGVKYYWISYQSIENELPFLGLGKRSIMMRMFKLRDLGILSHYTKKEGGTFSFYALSHKYNELISSNVDSNEESTDELVSLDANNHKNEEGLFKNSNKGCAKECRTKTSILNNSSTIVTNIYNNIKDKVASILNYLNSKVGVRYKASNPKTISLIEARLREGFTFDDFKSVIDKKVKEWKGTSFEQYLTPFTLFGDKFEIYLNQKIVNQQESKNLRFHNFKGRDYDYADLEKKLLGWDR